MGACASAHSVLAEPPLFQSPLSVDVKALTKEGIQNASAKLAYISPAVGSFVLAGAKGHAIFRYNHDLDVDVHRHDLTFAGVAGGGDYVVYSIDHHEGEFIIFALKQVKGDEGFRIFYMHVERNPGGVDEKHTHLWCLDAKQFEYHEHRAD
jgi:hypothetical protein